MARSRRNSNWEVNDVAWACFATSAGHMLVDEANAYWEAWALEGFSESDIDNIYLYVDK